MGSNRPDGRAPGGARPRGEIQKLQDRIDAVAHGAYADKDCRRYAKRLRIDGRYLLTFLECDADYHNSTRGRALRIFACMRKALYGNRSEAGMETTKTPAVVYATCELHGVNPYHFFRDYLDGKVSEIPMPQTPTIAA